MVYGSQRMTGFGPHLTGTDILGPQKMMNAEFVVPLTFHWARLWGGSFWILVKCLVTAIELIATIWWSADFWSSTTSMSNLSLIPVEMQQMFPHSTKTKSLNDFHDFLIVPLGHESHTFGSVWDTSNAFERTVIRLETTTGLIRLYQLYPNCSSLTRYSVDIHIYVSMPAP